MEKEESSAFTFNFSTKANIYKDNFPKLFVYSKFWKAPEVYLIKNLYTINVHNTLDLIPEVLKSSLKNYIEAPNQAEIFFKIQNCESSLIRKIALNTNKECFIN